MIDDQLRSALVRCAAASPLLVACDYDGTLSPLVDDPTRAVPHGPAVQALVRLADMDGVEAVIISGRSLAALRALSGEPPSVMLIGTHGAEPDTAVSDPTAERPPDQTASLVRDLRAVVAHHPGTVLEEKTVGAAVHYRHAPNPEPAVEAVRTVAAEHGARVIEGKMVLEVLLGDADKGSALAELRRSVEAQAMVFIGDDTTDEDVFVTLGSHDVGIKVGDGPTAAVHRVADPGAVADALRLLADFRQTVGV